MWYYAGFPLPIPHLGVRLDTCTHPFAANPCGSARLACFNHAASVQSEPESNSSLVYRRSALRPVLTRRKHDLLLVLPRYVTTGLPHGFHREPAEASPPVVAELNNSICFQTFKGYQAHIIIVAMSSSFPAEAEKTWYGLGGFVQKRGATHLPDRALSRTTQLFTFERVHRLAAGPHLNFVGWGQDDRLTPTLVKPQAQKVFVHLSTGRISTTRPRSFTTQNPDKTGPSPDFAQSWPFSAIASRALSTLLSTADCRRHNL